MPNPTPRVVAIKPAPGFALFKAIVRTDTLTGDLFDMPVPVKGYTDKHGVVHAPTTAIRKKRATKPVEPDPIPQVISARQTQASNAPAQAERLYRVTPVKTESGTYILQGDDGGKVVDRKAARSGINLFGLPLMGFETKAEAISWAQKQKRKGRNMYEVAGADDPADSPGAETSPLASVRHDLADEVRSVIAEEFQSEPAATPLVSVDVTGLSSADAAIAYDRLFAGKMSRGEFRAAQKAGQLNDRGADIMAAIKAKKDEDKAAKRAKNDAWRDKNLPKMVAAKRAEQEAKIDAVRARVNAQGDPDGARTYLSVPFSEKEMAKRAGARWDAEKRQWYHTHPETPEALRRYLPKIKQFVEVQKQFDALSPPPPAPKPQSSAPKALRIPTRGRITDDDPSLYGSWLLGHEGESWASVQHLIPKQLSVESSKAKYASDWRDETNWHTRTQMRMKTLPDESLRYIIKDASEAAEIIEKMHPGEQHPKAGQYRDEAHYASMELQARRQGKAGLRKALPRVVAVRMAGT